jgi:hypothetical protein
MTDDAEKDQGREIPIHDPERDTPPMVELYVARSHAIEAYAVLENSLASLFTHLSETPTKIGGIIFYRIVNTRSRNTIIEQMLHERRGTDYNAFWNSVAKLIQGLDQKRNEIIHWHTVQSLAADENGTPISSFNLMPPNFWSFNQRTPVHNAKTLTEFSDECDVVSRGLNMFGAFLAGQLPAEIEQLWREIFQQPLVYPLPEGHPLSRNYTKPQSQPRS